MHNVKYMLKNNGEELSLIPLPLAVRGFSEFLCSWLLRSGSGTVLIDCGVAGSYGHLRGALDSLGAVPDALLLTHIHLDHSGAAGHLCRDFPNIKVFCFERAAKHLISPQKLWNATAATLGSALANAYLPPLAVPAENIIDRTRLLSCWKVIDTPGHAQHHVSFLRNFAGARICFGGEALGVVTGTGSESWFSDGIVRSVLRPATPPKYIPEVGRNSMRLLAEEDWDVFCCAHGGMSADRTLPARALAQNEFWERTIARAMADGMDEDAVVRLMTEKDPELADLKSYTPDDRAREIYFFHNSARGFMQYLAEKR